MHYAKHSELLSVSDIMTIYKITRSRASGLLKQYPYRLINIGNTIRVPSKSFIIWLKTEQDLGNIKVTQGN